MTSPAIMFDSVRKTFSSGGQEVVAIADLSFAVSAGEYITVLGRSGCGKSTAIHLLLGLSAPSAGRISVLGVDPLRDFSALRGRVACVFQTDRLLPWRSAIDNVRLPLEILHLEETALAVSPAQWLRRLGLSGFDHALPHQMSGGMRQRVALARALASNPDVLLADEAFGSLDEVTAEQLRRDFRQLAKETGKTVLHITHSIDEALTVSDRIIVLDKPAKALATFTGLDGVDARQRERLRGEILRTLRGTGGELSIVDSAA